jgi:hypothetical protein
MLSGCYHIQYVTDANPAAKSNGEKLHSNYALGLVEDQPTDVTKECPGGFAKVEHVMTPGDAVLTAIIAVIPVVDLINLAWQRSHVTLTCVGPAEPVPNGSTPPVAPTSPSSSSTPTPTK